MFETLNGQPIGQQSLRYVIVMMYLVTHGFIDTWFWISGTMYRGLLTEDESESPHLDEIYCRLVKIKVHS